MDLFFTVLSNLFTINNILLTFGGAFFGILVGAMPGLSSVMGLSIMLPFAIRVGGVGSILMLLGIYCGAVYGGSITAILINTPGTANSAATCLDGHPMALRGEAGRAISLSTTSSLIGGLLSAVVLLFTAPLLSRFALKFGSAEYFALGIFGLSIVTSVSSTENVLKGILGALLGLFLATIGMDAINGEPRFTAGSVFLLGGINFVPVLIGLFAFSQGLISIEEYNKNLKQQKTTTQKIKGVFPSKEDMKLCLPTFIRSSIIGIVIGIIFVCFYAFYTAIFSGLFSIFKK